MIDTKLLEQYSKIIPLTVNNLTDLRDYGALSSREFNKHLQTGDGPYEVPYIQNSERAFIDDSSWKYEINSYNFRNTWDLEAKRKIGFFGCSFTFGEGIKYEDTFVKIVSDSINYAPFNFGAGGSSVERVARTFSAVTRLIDLDIAVITLPAWHRQLHVGSEGDMINLIPSYPHNGYVGICNTLTNLSEDFYSVRAATSINWIYDIASNKNIKIIFSSWDHSVNYFCHLLLNEHTIKPFPNIDNKKARDKMHPGPKSQRAHATQIIEAINDRAWV